MKLYIHSANPRRRPSRALTAVWIVLGAALTACVAAVCVRILMEESAAGTRVGSAAMVAGMYLAVLLIFSSTRMDARRSFLEVENGRVTEHTYALFIHRRQTCALGDVAGFARVQRGYRRGQAVWYVAAVNAKGETLFELLDCEENRRCMEQLTRLPCNP